MRSWKGRTLDGTFSVELQGAVLRTLDDFCHQTGLSETGGILVGRYSDDHSVAIVSEATPPPPDSRQGHSWFSRGVNGLRDMLSKRWRDKERTYYIGEWHFHPADHVVPSSDDFAQMIEIGHAKDYKCTEPLLLILGAGKIDGDRQFRIFVCPAGTDSLELLSSRC